VGNGGAPASGGAANIDSGVECQLDNVHRFAPGDTFPRDCNTCTCASDGTIRCTTELCSCVDRPSHHGLTDTFSFLSMPPDALPECLPSCGASPHFGDAIRSVDALPTGACDPFTFGCTMRAHEGCRCPNEAGAVDSFVCLCDSGAWNCQVTSKGASTCADACDPDAGVSDSGAPAPCDLTNQLAVSGAGAVWSSIDGQLLVEATLTNRGPRDHNAYPGIEVTSDVNTGTLTNAFYALRSGESASLGVSLQLAMNQACSTINFHIRAHSFGSETNCPGQSVDVSFFFQPNGNCPQCPVASPSEGQTCSIPGLFCDYQCRPGNCSCMGGHWTCGVCI
jgi:hypothetical protein